MEKITKRQLNGYLKARRDGITFNDCYNLDVYEIDLETYDKISKTARSLYGIFPPKMINLAALNREFSDLQHASAI